MIRGDKATGKNFSVGTQARRPGPLGRGVAEEVGEELGVNHSGDAIFPARLGRAPCRKNVLAIPDLNLPDIPNPRTDAVIASKTVFIEEILPEVRPVAVDMVLTRLVGTAGGKNDVVGMIAKALDQIS